MIPPEDSIVGRLRFPQDGARSAIAERPTTILPVGASWQSRPPVGKKLLSNLVYAS
jgi:hypothetical protein